MRRRCFILTIFALIGCGGGAADGAADWPGRSRRHRGRLGPRLIFITNGSSDWWTTVEKGMHDGAKEFGAQVEMRRCEGEPAQQIQRIEDVLSLPDVQGVAISVLEAESPGIADKMKSCKKPEKS